MNWQVVIVFLIIALAVSYFGSKMFRKAKSFSPENSCGDDCGCGTKSKKL